MFNRHLDVIEAVVGVGRILDVGCANGDFLKEARKRGWDVLGADPSVARAEVESSGIQLVGTTVRNAQVEEGTLDAITFWDVLEHVADPIADLSRACELLKPEGVIALTVPDSSNFLARVSGRRWFGYKTAGEHLQFFTPVSLRQAFDRAGLSLRVRRPTRWSCTFGFLTDRAGLYLGWPGRQMRRALSGSRLMTVIVDVPQINQFALGGPARVTSQVRRGAES
jgi:SAM-dependent methyltransferase